MRLRETIDHEALVVYLTWPLIAVFVASPFLIYSTSFMYMYTNK